MSSLQPKSTTGRKLRYRFKTKPFSHQKRALQKLLELNGRGGLFMEMGTGKTKVAIDWAGIGFHNWDVRKVLVVAPLSVLGVWPRQIRQHSEVPSRVFRLEGSTRHRVYLLRRIIKAPKNEVLTYLIINYEGIWRETDRGSSVKDLLIKWAPDIIIFDESHRLKHPASKQSRVAFQISKTVPQRLALTGTAITKSPLDAYGQFRAVNTDIFGTRWSEFKFRYGVWGGYGHYQLKGYRNLRELITKLRANSFRIRKDQCLDLPPKLFETVPIVLPDSILRKYRQMAKEMIVEIEDTHATAAIVLVKLLRLSQMANGFVKDVEGNIRAFDDTKLKVCMDLIDDLLEEDHKVVIFVRFRFDIERISERLSRKHVSYRILSGSVPPSKRDSIIEEFHNDPTVTIFIAQIQAGSLGIDLTPADAAIFYSLDYNAEHYWQAQDRLHRIGQDRKVTYYHLVASGTIDRVVLEVLREKGNLAKTILHKPQLLLES